MVKVELRQAHVPVPRRIDESLQRGRSPRLHVLLERGNDHRLLFVEDGQKTREFSTLNSSGRADASAVTPVPGPFRVHWNPVFGFLKKRLCSHVEAALL